MFSLWKWSFLAVRLPANVGRMTVNEMSATADTAPPIPVRLDFDHRLRELVRVRASQLNGCAYCIDMHTKDARAVGETEQRIYALSAWAETPFFTPRERGALAFTEVVTLAAQTRVPDAAYDEVASHFSPEEVAALLSLVVTINAWNAIGVTTHAWEPGSYQP